MAQDSGKMALNRRSTIAGLGALGMLLLNRSTVGKALADESGLAWSDQGSLHELTVREVLAAFAKRRFTAREYIEALLDWQSRWSVLNVFISQDIDKVRAAAAKSDTLPRNRFPLAGLPIVLKDNIDLEGYVTTAGTPGLRNHRPQMTAPMLQGLIDRGAVVMGKVGLHELAAGGTNANITFGQIRNPYNLDMVPGGSSGGTAAAVAAGLVPAGLGTDTGGSVREPAAMCGCVGFRPTAGRYDTTGVVPRNASRDSIGWMTRSSADVAILDAYSGTPAVPARPISLKNLRLGVPRQYFYEQLDPSVEKVVEDALNRLKKAGVELIEADIPNLRQLRQSTGRPTRGAFARDLESYLRYSGATVTAADVIHAIPDRELRKDFEESLNAMSDSEIPYDPAKDKDLQVFKHAYVEYFERNRVAAIVIPTTPDLAFPYPRDPASGRGRDNKGPSSGVRNTGPGAAAGLPGLSVPAGLSPTNLPVGVEFDGPANSDLTVLAIGIAFESISEPLPLPSPPKLR